MPENLLKRIILASSDIDDIVLDPFGGTGTTAIVAKKLRRHFITIEISEEYYNNILKRVNNSTIEIENTIKTIEQEQLFN